MNIGDKVYYENSTEEKPIGTLVGIRETRWSDSYQSKVFLVVTEQGYVRRFFENVTNVPPLKKK